MKEELKVIIDEDKIAKRIKEIANKIEKDYSGKKLHIVCVLKGSVFFMCELAKHINMPVTLDFMSVSSYGDGLVSSGYINIVQDLTMDIKGRNVIIVEDIVDSGKTISYLCNMLKKREPESVAVCTLLDKPARRETDVKLDYVGFEVPDSFIVGIGLDYAQKYRNLPYLAELKIKEE